MLYTIMPVEEIYRQDYYENIEFNESVLDGQLVQTMKADNQVTISRLFSTDPRQYLKKEFCPGRAVKNQI